MSVLREKSAARKAWFWLMTRITINIERYVLTHVDHVFAESNYTRDLVEPYVAPERLSVAFPGVDTSVFVPSDYCEDGYILAVGRWSDPRKNVRLLFEAYHQLCLSRPGTPRLVLVGMTGPREADWRYAKALGVADAIEIKVAVSAEHLPEIYRQAALFVLTSNEEGLGIVILEAMACGLPVVSTRCGGPESAVVDGETGLLTPSGQASELASAMQQLLDDPVRRQQMGQAGRRLVERVFSLEAAGNAYLNTYRDLLNRTTC
jgi:glycosyltransferase involved in cell wall biosynthesis